MWFYVHEHPKAQPAVVWDLKYLSALSLGRLFQQLTSQRTSDGGNGNHSVSLPIILITIKVNQMLPSSYICSFLVSILWFCIWIPFSINVQLYFGAKMVTFCIIHIGNIKIFLKHHPPPPRVPTNPFARKCVIIFY